MQFIKKITKISTEANRALRNLNYHNNHKNKALQAVSNIEKFNSHKLSRQQKKIADDYSVEIFGSKKYAPWLYVYTLVRGEFKEGWIPDNFFGKLVCPKINREVGGITHLKSLTKLLLQTEALPDIAYHIDGNLYDKDMTIVSADKLRKSLIQEHQQIFFKADGTRSGRGVRMGTVEDINEMQLKEIGNCVVQIPIKHHEYFDRMVSGSIAKFRITTVKEKDGIIGMRSAYLGLYRANSTGFQSKDIVKIAVTNNFGELDKFGYTKDWRRWSSHPDTNFSFANERIPKFSEAVKVCIGLHKKIPHLSIIGWDVIISKDETIKVIEWNGGHPDIKFSEATTGPCFVGLNWEEIINRGGSELVTTSSTSSTFKLKRSLTS